MGVGGGKEASLSTLTSGTGCFFNILAIFYLHRLLHGGVYFPLDTCYPREHSGHILSAPFAPRGGILAIFYLHRRKIFYLSPFPKNFPKKFSQTPNRRFPNNILSAGAPP